MADSDSFDARDDFKAEGVKFFYNLVLAFIVALVGKLFSDKATKRQQDADNAADQRRVDAEKDARERQADAALDAEAAARATAKANALAAALFRRNGDVNHFAALANPGNGDNQPDVAQSQSTEIDKIFADARNDIKKRYGRS